MSVLPEVADFIIRKIEDNRYEAYLVGGSVRDMLMGKKPNDIDITTNALPADIKRIFGDYIVIETGIKHGTVTVLKDEIPIEITTYRTEEGYSDGRHPDKVTFTTNITEDLSRRDFTINSIAYNPKSGYFDPFNGKKDIENKIICCVGDPKVRFEEDALRILRALRFSSVLGFDIENKTSEAIHECRHLLKNVSAERIYSEISKMLCGINIRNILTEYADVISVLIPEIKRMINFDQKNFHHKYDLLKHTAEVVTNTPPIKHLRFSALLHDIAKPVTKRYDPALGWTFHGHEVVGARWIPKIFQSMKMPLNEKMKYVQKLVNLHLRPIALVTDEVTDSAVRRLLFDAGNDIDDLMLLCNADITSKNPRKVARLRSNFELVKTKLVEVEEKDAIRNFKNPITGDYVMALFGIEPCNTIGQLKEKVKNAILDGEIENTFEAADAYMRQCAAEIGLFPKE